jgi:hypothetical protein
LRDRAGRRIRPLHAAFTTSVWLDRKSCSAANGGAPSVAVMDFVAILIGLVSFAAIYATIVLVDRI